ncbi:threonine--tRNA ligase [bacterium]|jgi:threonyl-tRNA synthetase|nr:threonine--tRNA ligase [bacterium]MBT4122138.1 threonine--tRNA ligase [bacterium]MBT4335490.1 threonine--tRNA ligase [bacterium]MBT4495485.1 threonine--tRNA ligase [bacterium]MBT4764332.1 threonine--tRNA ligase [bacterium]
MNNELEKIRHSLSHLMAMAVLKKFPKAKLAIGPVIENGFYYDFDLGKDNKITEMDLLKLQKEMKKLISQNIEFKKIVAKDKKEALKMMSGEFKKELIEELPKSEKITFYESGDFTDLCAGPHVESTKEINKDGFKLTKTAGAYWRGDEKNKMLTRIYGVAFNNKKELDEYLEMLAEAEKRDHRKLGKELDLFVFSPIVGKGLPLWTEKGTTIRRELENFIIAEEIKRGYKHVNTPDIAKIDLYKKSGHYPYYKDSMYSPIKIDDEEFMLRPMSCPHHFELYLSRPRSYKELPLRIAEVAKLYRYEQSGELTGLMRVRSFCLADSHIICADSAQAKSEVNDVLDLIEYISNTFGLKMGDNYSYRLSLGDRKDTEKYFKNDKAWDEAETILRDVLKNRKCKFVEAESEAAFYGPKIDIQMKNVLGKEETAFTVQYDFVMPERFNLNYIDKDGKEKKAIVIHRSSIGAIERVMAFLIEHFAGAFPLWLSPIQVKIISVGEAHFTYCEELANKFKSQGIRVETDLNNETVGNKIRKAVSEKTPYMLVIGDKEVASNDLAVRVRGQEKILDIGLDKFITNLKKTIEDKSLTLE